jgi:hypothetical protein
LAGLDLEEDGEMADEDDTALDLRGRAPGGVGGWLEEEEDEWRDEVGESYYLDMLRDDARNQGAPRDVSSANAPWPNSSRQLAKFPACWRWRRRACVI